MKAKTDGGPQSMNSAKPDYIENIFQLMRLVSDKDFVRQVETDFNNCTIRYGDLKKQLGEDMVKFIAPIRQKATDILHDEKYLQDIMETGAEKARASAGRTMKIVREAMGLNYF